MIASLGIVRFARDARAPIWIKAAFVAAALGFAWLAILIPNTYTNRYILDSFYLLNAGYLIHSGLTPHVDFSWQFGGYEAYLIGSAFRLFGVTFKGIEQAITLGFCVTAGLFYLGVARQARLTTFCLLLLLVTAVSLTWFPFEDGNIDMGRQSFAMFYNRICWALAIVGYATLLLSPERLRQRELFVCAAAAFLILTTKITFALLLVPALAPLIHRNGMKGLIHAMLYLLALVILAWVTLGYGPMAYVNSVHDIFDATGEALNLNHAIRKFGYILIYNVFGIAVALIGIGYSAWKRPRSRWLIVKLGVLLALLLLSLVETVLTGVLNYFISATTPIIAFIAIMSADDARRVEEGGSRMLAAALAFYAIAFSAPYLMNTVAGLRGQARLGSQSLFEAGALRGLIVEQPESGRSPLFANQAAGVTYIAARNRLEGGIKWQEDYERQYVIADGMRLAQQVPGIARRQVLTFSPSIMPFALRAAPITAFPLFGGSDSSSVKTMPAIPAPVDTVLIQRDEVGNLLQQRFSPSLAKDFALTGRSALWDLYVRKTKPGA
jgi:hypothetical protein